MLFYTRGIMAARIPCPPAEYATRIRNPPREDGRVSWLLEHGHEMTKSILFRLRLSSLTLRPRLLKHQTTIPNAMAENTPTTTPMATPAFLLKPPGRDASDDGSLLVCDGSISNNLCDACSLYTLEKETTLVLTRSGRGMDNLHRKVTTRQAAALDG